MNAPVTVTIDDHDGLKAVTTLAMIGVVTAAVLAVIGGFPIDMPMPTHAWGWVEPTCGLTRGSTAIVRGDWALAWRYNPGSFVVMALGTTAFVRGLVGLVWRRWANLHRNFAPLTRSDRWAVTAAVVAVVVGWALHQQTNAEFIINSRA